MPRSHSAPHRCRSGHSALTTTLTLGLLQLLLSLLVQSLPQQETGGVVAQLIRVFPHPCILLRSGKQVVGVAGYTLHPNLWCKN